METEQIGKLNGGEGGGDGKEVVVARKRTIRVSDLLIRFMAFTFSLAASLLLGLDKETKIVPISLVPSLPPLRVAVTAKWQYLSAFTFFVVANAVACSYGAISLILTLINRSGFKQKGLSLTIIILDLVMVGLLSSAIGAATAVGMIGQEGNSHLHWDKVCNVFGKYCRQVAGAVVVCGLGSLSFLFLVLLAAVDLHKKF